MSDRRTPPRLGRPTKYTPEMCDAVIALGEDGAGKAEMAKAIGIDRDTFKEWCKTNPIFSAAVKKAVDASQAWWEEQGRRRTFDAGPMFSATSYIFQMKNRFPDDWRDVSRQEQTGAGGGPVKIAWDDGNDQT